ncbi:MAG: LytTR family transcriptional regulator, partial [Candidatus Mcinerneyibacterium aminivorans]
KIMFFNPDDIIYITKDGRYSIIKTKEKDYLCSKPLKYFDKKLEKYSIIRVRRNYLVNMKFVKEIQKKDSRKYIIILNDRKQEIKVGIRYINEIVNS